MPLDPFLKWVSRHEAEEAYEALFHLGMPQKESLSRVEIKLWRNASGGLKLSYKVEGLLDTWLSKGCLEKSGHYELEESSWLLFQAHLEKIRFWHLEGLCSEIDWEAQSLLLKGWRGRDKQHDFKALPEQILHPQHLMCALARYLLTLLPDHLQHPSLKI